MKHPDCQENCKIVEFHTRWREASVIVDGKLTLEKLPKILNHSRNS